MRQEPEIVSNHIHSCAEIMLRVDALEPSLVAVLFDEHFKEEQIANLRESKRTRVAV